MIKFAIYGYYYWNLANSVAEISIKLPYSSVYISLYAYFGKSFNFFFYYFGYSLFSLFYISFGLLI